MFLLKLRQILTKMSEKKIVFHSQSELVMPLQLTHNFKPCQGIIKACLVNMYICREGPMIVLQMEFWLNWS